MKDSRQQQTQFTDFTEDYGHTEPLVDFAEGNGSVGETDPVEPMDGDYEPTVRYEEEDDGHTVPDYLGVAPAGEGKAAIIPVTGWLVCVAGPGKGTDYRLHGGYNQIGRGRGLDVMVIGDPKISEKPMAWIAYDPVSRTFAIGANAGTTNFFYLNGKPLYANQTVGLAPHDRVRMGDTTLIFQPLCGADFSWEEQ